MDEQMMGKVHYQAEWMRVTACGRDPRLVETTGLAFLVNCYVCERAMETHNERVHEKEHELEHEKECSATEGR